MDIPITASEAEREAAFLLEVRPSIRGVPLVEEVGPSPQGGTVYAILYLGGTVLVVWDGGGARRASFYDIPPLSSPHFP